MRIRGGGYAAPSYSLVDIGVADVAGYPPPLSHSTGSRSLCPLVWNFFQAKSSIYLSVNRSIDLFSSFRHTCGTRNVCLEVASVKCRHNAQPLCLPLIGPNLNFKNTPAEKIFLQRTVCRRKRTSPRRSCSDVVFRSLELPSQNIPASPSRRERIS